MGAAAANHVPSVPPGRTPAQPPALPCPSPCVAASPQVAAKLLGIGVKALHQRCLDLYGCRWAEFVAARPQPAESEGSPEPAGSKGEGSAELESRPEPSLANAPSAAPSVATLPAANDGAAWQQARAGISDTTALTASASAGGEEQHSVMSALPLPAQLRAVAASWPCRALPFPSTPELAEAAARMHARAPVQAQLAAMPSCTSMAAGSMAAQAAALVAPLAGFLADLAAELAEPHFFQPPVAQHTYAQPAAPAAPCTAPPAPAPAAPAAPPELCGPGMERLLSLDVPELDFDLELASWEGQAAPPQQAGHLLF